VLDVGTSAATPLPFEKQPLVEVDDGRIKRTVMILGHKVSFAKTELHSL